MMNTPHTPTDQLKNALAIADECKATLAAAYETAKSQLDNSSGTGAEHAGWGLDESTALATEIIDVAGRVQAIAAKFIELAGVALEQNNAETDSGVVGEDSTEFDGSDIVHTNEDPETELITTGYELGTTEAGITDTENPAVETSNPKERKMKPRYSERQLDVVKRIIERIKPGEEFRQSQLNSEDLEGLSDKEKQNLRSFYSTVLVKLLEDGLIGHNGKQRGGSKSVLENVEGLKALIEAEGYVDETGMVIPPEDRFVKRKAAKQKKVGGKRQPVTNPVAKSEKPEEIPYEVAREKRIQERRELRQAAIFSQNVVGWIGTYIKASRTKAPTPKKVAEAVAVELEIDTDIAQGIIQNLLNGGLLFDHRRHKGSRIISLDAPTEQEISIRRRREDEISERRQDQSQYGPYFSGDEIAFKERYGEIKGVRRSDINCERGIVSFEGLEKIIVAYFYDTKERSAVAYKHVIAAIERKHGIKVNKRELELSVELINALTHADFFELLGPASRATASKGPRLRLRGSFMEDSHARIR